MEKRCKCGEPHDGWPGEGGDMLCQMCWEAECDASWWRMVIALSGGTPEKVPPTDESEAA